MRLKIYFKKTIYCMVIIVFLPHTNTFGGGRTHKNESCFTKSSKSILRGFKSLFECSSRNLRRGSYQEIEDLTDLELGREDINNVTTILSLDNVVLCHIATFLTPPDIIKLIKSNTHFKCLRAPDFWLQYNRMNKNATWDIQTLPIQVSFAYYWFNNRKYEKAASLGFLLAKEIIQKRSKLLKEADNKPIQYHRESSSYEVTSRIWRYKSLN